jgi:cell wall-associated NlpC family hydrolase
LQTFVLKPEMDERIDNAIAWALDWADGPPYPPGGPHADEMYIGWCLAFVQDAYQYGAGAEIQRYEYAKQAADALGAENNRGIPPRGAFVFYNW